MNDKDFTTLKETILAKGGRHSSGYASWDRSPPIPYWATDWSNPIYIEWLSNRSKYKGSILRVDQIRGDKIHATCTISGAPRISAKSHYKNFELTHEKGEKFVDPKFTNETVKDFFNDDINVGDYVFGEYNRDVLFGIVRSTKKGEPNLYKSYSSKIMKYDSAMIEIIKAKYRSDGSHNTNYMAGKKKLLEMKYFIKVEDPTLYLLKI